LNQNHRDWLCVRFLIVIECVRLFGAVSKDAAIELVLIYKDAWTLII